MSNQAKPTSVPPRPIPQWFRDAKLGMFIHWGLYSLTEHGEQPLFRELLIPSDYRQLAKRFTAEHYDPRQWAQVAKNAEMRYMVLTTKHHDGYCLFDTATTDYNAVRTAPQRDLVKPYVEACRAAGLRVGLYYSLPDWSVPAYFARPATDPRGWDAFIELIKTQLRELLTNYGPIDLLWFDHSPNFPAEEWRPLELMSMIYELQPNILVNNRLQPPAGHPAWGYPTPEQRIGEKSHEPWESCFTSTRAFWGYHRCHEDPTMWRSERELMEVFAAVACGGGNLLHNVGPYPDGRLPQTYVEQTRHLGEWVRHNREGVYGTQPAPFEFKYGGTLATRERQLYLWFLYWPGTSFSLPGFNEKVLSARLLHPRQTVAFRQEAHRVVLENLPSAPPHPLCSVVELTFDAPPTAHPWAAKKLWSPDTMGLEAWARL